MTTIISIVFLVLFVAVYAIINGYFILSADVKNDKARSLWHLWGVVLRILPIAYVVCQSWGKWWEIGLFTLVYCNLSWTVYDAIISIIIYGNVWQNGTTSKTDKLIKNSWIYKLVLLIIFISYMIVFLKQL
jgi:hypothetical protein